MSFIYQMTMPAAAPKGAPRRPQYGFMFTCMALPRRAPRGALRRGAIVIPYVHLNLIVSGRVKLLPKPPCGNSGTSDPASVPVVPLFLISPILEVIIQKNTEFDRNNRAIFGGNK